MAGRHARNHLRHNTLGNASEYEIIFFVTLKSGLTNKAKIDLNTLSDDE